MTTKNYTIDQLQIPENFDKLPSKEQQIISANFNEKYENILNRIEKGETAFFYEKEFLYETFKHRNYLLLKSHFELFKDFHFLELHQKYRYNLKNEHKVPVVINGSDQEIINNHFLNLDLNDLEEIFNEWNNEVINNDNLSSDIMTNTNKLINELKSEAKFQIKNFIKEYKDVNLNYDLNSKYTMFVLYSKHIYLLSSKIKETFNNGKCYHPIFLNNKEIRFSEMSLVHVLIRHYSPLSKISAKNMMKSHHKKDFLPEELHLDLAFIFQEINNSQLLKNSNLFENIQSENKDITFQFKENIYRVWLSLNKNENESGQIPFIEIETFHPLDDKDDLIKLNSDFRIMKINNDLSVYIEKHSIENICLN